MHGRSSHTPTDAPADTLPGTPDVAIAGAPGERTTSPGAMGVTAATLPHADPGPAVVLLGVAEAVVARSVADGRDEIVRVPRATRRHDAQPFFVRVFHEIGNRTPVAILGPASERTAFEREFVLISHRPDRLLEDASVHDSHPEALLGRLRALRGHVG